MSSVEVPNLVDTIVKFTAANPPVIIARSANVVGVTRSNTGRYVAELRDKLPYAASPGSPVACVASGFAGFSSAEANTDGNLYVEHANTAGAYADDGTPVTVVVYRLPFTG